MPDWQAIDERLAAASSFSLSLADRAQIARRAKQAGAAEVAQALADGVEAAARAELRRRALLADLPRAEQRPEAVPAWPIIAEALADKAAALREAARLALALRNALEGFAEDIYFPTALAALTVGRREMLPVPGDDDAWTALNADCLRTALAALDRVATATRWAMPPDIPDAKVGHELSRLVFAIRDAIDHTLPLDSDARQRFQSSAAAPNGLLVQITAVALSAMCKAGATIAGQSDLRKTVARIIKAERDFHGLIDRELDRVRPGKPPDFVR